MLTVGELTVSHAVVPQNVKSQLLKVASNVQLCMKLGVTRVQ